MVNVPENIKMLLSRIPESPGVYQYLDKDGVIIYVGKAKNLRRRVNSYFQKEQEWMKTRQLVRHIADIKYVVVDTEQDAFLLENNLIKQYQPHYNILLKDGKSYPSICISREPFPRIFKTRNVQKSLGEFFGPYSYGNTVDLVLELIHHLYPLRTCHLSFSANTKHKVCLKYHLGHCCGICENKISSQQYMNYVDNARKIIKGDAQEIRRQIEKEMLSLSAQFKYEEAQLLKEQLDMLIKFESKTVITNTALGDLDVFGYEENGQKVYVSMLHIHNGSVVQGQTIELVKQLDEPREEVLSLAMLELRERLESTCKEALVPFLPDMNDPSLHLHIAVSGDKKRLLQLAMQNVHQYMVDQIRQSDRLNPDQRATRLLTGLQQLLNLPALPFTIHAFDNSNIQGCDAVAGCVVFVKAKPFKKDYRSFKIKTVDGPDDYASMREIVRRRYQDMIDHNEDLPNLIIADGGLGQMNAIREIVTEQLGLSIPVVGLKKDDKHRTNTLLFGSPVQEVGLKVTDEVFRFLVQIQDEVHRFAISIHRNKRSKSQSFSQLDDIQGVGPVVKKKILDYFHSVARARMGSLSEWKKLLGNSLGSKVYAYFQEDLSR